MPQQIASVTKPWVVIKDVPGGDVGSVHGRAPTPGNQYYGPFIYGSAYYTVVEVGQPSNNYWDTWYLAVMKSTDSGLTWAEVDTADHPLGHEVNASVYRSGDVLYIAFKKRNSAAAGDYNLTIVSFTLATEQWATVAATGPDPGGGGIGTKLVIRPNGDYVILHNTGSGRNVVDYPEQGVHYVIYDGSWGTPIRVGSVDDANFLSQQIQLDSVTDNLVHFYYVDTRFGASAYKHRSLDAVDALGTEQALVTVSTLLWALGVPVVYGGNLIVPFADDTGAVYYPWILIGTAEGDADPVWTTSQISSTVKIMPPTNSDNAASFAILDGAGDLVVFWVTPTPNAGMGIVNFLMYAVYDGSWSAAAIWVEDEALNADQDWWHNPSVVLDSNNVFQIVIDRIHRTYDDNAWSLTGFLYNPPATPAAQGTPYTW